MSKKVFIYINNGSFIYPYFTIFHPFINLNRWQRIKPVALWPALGCSRLCAAGQRWGQGSGEEQLHGVQLIGHLWNSVWGFNKKPVETMHQNAEQSGTINKNSWANISFMNKNGWKKFLLITNGPTDCWWSRPLHHLQQNCTQKASDIHCAIYPFFFQQLWTGHLCLWMMYLKVDIFQVKHKNNGSSWTTGHPKHLDDWKPCRTPCAVEGCGIWSYTRPPTSHQTRPPGCCLGVKQKINWNIYPFLILEEDTCNKATGTIFHPNFLVLLTVSRRSNHHLSSNPMPSYGVAHGSTNGDLSS